MKNNIHTGDRQYIYIKWLIYTLIVIDIIFGIKFLLTIPSIRKFSQLMTSVKPERYSELYFEDHENLPITIDENSSLLFKFTIHNLENIDMTYVYSVSASDRGTNKVLDKNKIEILSGDQKTISENFTFNHNFLKEKITVTLLNKNQSIHFWFTK